MHAAALVDSAQVILEPVYLGSVAVAGAKLCLTAHDRDGIRILEIEPSSPLPQSTAEVLAQARKTAALFDRALDHTELLQTAAREARRLTEFDRVMIYRFLRDGSGSVEAEDRAEALPPFLNHRYPASDIPKQARELYLRNLIRVIPDVSYTPAPLIPSLNPATKAPLDMSDCTLRSVSPIHVQYLKNMNVAASMSVSIVVDGALWGLVAFHHMSPKLVPYELREMCKHLGEIPSQQVKAREDAEAHRGCFPLLLDEKSYWATCQRPVLLIWQFSNSYPSLEVRFPPMPPQCYLATKSLQHTSRLPRRRSGSSSAGSLTQRDLASSRPTALSANTVQRRNMHVRRAAFSLPSFLGKSRSFCCGFEPNSLRRSTGLETLTRLQRRARPLVRSTRVSLSKSGRKQSTISPSLGRLPKSMLRAILDVQSSNSCKRKR